ncbi:MAG: MMPL family transporter [Atopostipes sp.]|nr:MMPL family transporter [Atopostipes sp.]
MNKFGEFIAKHKKLVLIIATILLVPAIYGKAMTGINYEILSYLPEELESIEGQDVLDEVFDDAANGMLVIEDMEDKDVVKTKESLKEIDGVQDILWVDDFVDISVPKDILPESASDLFYREDSTLLLVDFEDESSSAMTQKAIEEMRALLDKRSFLSGMPILQKDTRDLSDRQTPIYIGVAVILATIILMLTLESYLVPFVILISIAYSILYNMGTNIFFGEISYITESLAAVLQLGVTLDYSIFLLHRYEEESKKEKGKNKEKAMGTAIAKTASSIFGSSLTTVAGFLAIAFMELTIGKDIGFVMAKGVVLGFISVLTVLPAMILVFDKYINKFKHKNLLPEFDHLANFVTKHYRALIAFGVILFIPAFYGQENNEVYYNLDESLPDDMESVVALEKLKDDYDMMTTHMIVFPDEVENYEVLDMIDEIEEVEGVENVLTYQKLIGPRIPANFIPNAFKEKFEKEDYKQLLVNSEYKAATEEENEQIEKIDQIVKDYDKAGLITGEGALTKDLIEIADRDFDRVNILSFAAVFVIIMAVFKSISIPLFLILIIMLAIFVNMSVPFYLGQSIPFIAGIVIGSIQLGATVDYAILLTTRFKEELEKGYESVKAMKISIQESAKSIVTSGLAFFASTIGVAIISEMEIVKSLSLMIARGALISTSLILFVLPGILIAGEKLIAKTTMNWNEEMIEENN